MMLFCGNVTIRWLYQGDSYYAFLIASYSTWRRRHMASIWQLTLHDGKYHWPSTQRGSWDASINFRFGKPHHTPQSAAGFFFPPSSSSSSFQQLKKMISLQKEWYKRSLAAVITLHVKRLCAFIWRNIFWYSVATPKLLFDPASCSYKILVCDYFRKIVQYCSTIFLALQPVSVII